MEMNYRSHQEQLLNSNTLNQEILVHCIAKLNKKISPLYKKIKITETSYKHHSNNEYSSLALYDKQDFKALKHDYDCLIQKRKPLLNTLMKGYHLSLDNVKELLMQIDKNKLPTYKTIDKVV